MVAERLLGTVVYPEAFLPTVVIDPHSLSLPVLVALDAEMVVAFGRKCRQAGAGLQDALSQRDAGRDAAPVHLADGRGRPALDVPLLGRIGCRHRKEQRGDKRK